MNQWVPTSPCDIGCVPVTPPASHLRIGVRVIAFVLTALTLLTVGVLSVLLPRRARHGFWRIGARLCLVSMGVRLDIDDQRPAESRGLRGALIVANHISFLDIVAIATVAPARFVAKREVLQMGGFRYIAKLFGVLPHVRGDLGRLVPTVARVTDVLDRGRAVAVFPEGTTWCGGAAGSFRPAFFQSAVDAGVPVVPMRLTYTEMGRPAALVGFIGDDTVGSTFKRVVSARRLTVTVTVFDLQLPVPDRRLLAGLCERQIVGATPVPQVVALDGVTAPEPQKTADSRPVEPQTVKPRVPS